MLPLDTSISLKEMDGRLLATEDVGDAIQVDVDLYVVEEVARAGYRREKALPR